MQIQPQNNINFTGKERFLKAKERNKIIARLEQQKISYKIVDNVVYSGRDLKKLIRDRVAEMKLEQFEANLIKEIQNWRASKAKKAAHLDELVNGKSVGTQGLRLKIKKKIFA